MKSAQSQILPSDWTHRHRISRVANKSKQRVLHAPDLNLRLERSPSGALGPTRPVAPARNRSVGKDRSVPPQPPLSAYPSGRVLQRPLGFVNERDDAGKRASRIPVCRRRAPWMAQTADRRTPQVELGYLCSSGVWMIASRYRSHCAASASISRSNCSGEALVATRASISANRRIVSGSLIASAAAL